MPAPIVVDEDKKYYLIDNEFAKSKTDQPHLCEVQSLSSAELYEDLSKQQKDLIKLIVWLLKNDYAVRYDDCGFARHTHGRFMLSATKNKSTYYVLTPEQYIEYLETVPKQA